MTKNIYTQLKEAGCLIDNHYSDLYVKACPKAFEIIKANGIKATSFKNQIDGTLWVDIPFHYAPYWKERVQCMNVPIFNDRILNAISMIASELLSQGKTELKDIVTVGDNHPDLNSGIFILKYKKDIKKRIDFLKTN